MFVVCQNRDYSGKISVLKLIRDFSPGYQVLVNWIKDFRPSRDFTVYCCATPQWMQRIPYFTVTAYSYSLGNWKHWCHRVVTM